MKRKGPHRAEFKFKVALEAIKGRKTTAELCQEYQVVSSQLFAWKKALLEGGEQVFKSAKNAGTLERESVKLHATIGRLKVENYFLAKVAWKYLSEGEYNLLTRLKVNLVCDAKHGCCRYVAVVCIISRRLLRKKR